MYAEGFVDLASKLLLLFSKTAELRLCHFDIATNILAITIVAFSGAKMNLADTIVLCIITAFLDHSISEHVDKVGKVKTAGSTIRRSAHSRHLAKP